MKGVAESVVLKVPQKLDQEELKDFYGEILTIAKLSYYNNCENIIKCYGWSAQPPHDIPHLICEFMECGDLKTILERSKF